MKQIYVLLIVAILACAFTQAQQSPPVGTIKNLDPKTFQKSAQKQQGIVLDVRTPQEYAKGHLANARNLDIFHDNFKEDLRRLDKKKRYFVYCHSGGRSTEAVELMQQMGFMQIYNLDGGITAWKEAGLPVEKSK